MSAARTTSRAERAAALALCFNYSGGDPAWRGRPFHLRAHPRPLAALSLITQPCSATLQRAGCLASTQSTMVAVTVRPGFDPRAC